MHYTIEHFVNYGKHVHFLIVLNTEEYLWYA